LDKVNNKKEELVGVRVFNKQTNKGFGFGQTLGDEI
jgi:hypothetical protein